jgi:isopentenyldiphosphate isomerase
MQFCKNMALLNVIDENGNVVGQDTRENIHKNGLLHQEVHVWFYTPNKEIIFQRRGMNQDTYPGLLDATAGGHVEIGDTIWQSALKEIKEETGLMLINEDLKFIKSFHKNSFDSLTGNTNNRIYNIFTYLYKNKIDDLQVEVGKADGFEVWPIAKILSISEEDKKQFIRSIFDEDILQIFRQLYV